MCIRCSFLYIVMSARDKVWNYCSVAYRISRNYRYYITVRIADNIYITRCCTVYYYLTASVISYTTCWCVTTMYRKEALIHRQL